MQNYWHPKYDELQCWNLKSDMQIWHVPINQRRFSCSRFHLAKLLLPYVIIKFFLAKTQIHISGETHFCSWLFSMTMQQQPVSAKQNLQPIVSLALLPLKINLKKIITTGESQPAGRQIVIYANRVLIVQVKQL